MDLNNTQKITLVFLLFALIGGALFFVTLRSPFLLDDIPQIVENPDIKNFDNLSNVFKKGFLPLYYLGKKDQWYRPLQTVSYMADYHFWRMDVKGYHITCIALHVLCAFLVFIFLFIILKKWFVPVLTGLFFLIHPINTEAVNYISSRGDPLLVLFITLSFICWASFLKKSRLLTYLGALISFSLALLCKETAIIFPVMAVFYTLLTIKKPEITRMQIFGLLGFFIIAGVYLVIRENMPILHISEVAYNMSFPDRILNFVRLIGSYSFILAWPLALNIGRYFPPPSGILDPYLITGILALGGSLYLLIRSWKDQNRLNIFFLSWFFISFVPTSGLFLPTTVIAAERYLYLPSIALFFFLASGIKRLLSIEKARISILAGTVVISCFWGFATFSRNMEWTDLIKFYSSAIERNPDSSHRTDLAKEYADKGDLKKAIQLYEQALNYTKTPGDILLPLNNMGNIYTKLKMLDKAEASFQKIIDINPNFTRAYLGMGNIYFAKGDLAAAIKEYEKVIQKGDTYPGVYLNIGICYERMRDLASAEEYFKKAMQIDPAFTPSYTKLAVVYINQNKLNEAEILCKTSLKIKPGDPGAHIMLGNIYLMKHDLQNAENHYKTALRIAPTALPAYLGLGHVHAQKGEKDKARAIFQKVLSVIPDNREARKALNNL